MIFKTIIATIVICAFAVGGEFITLPATAGAAGFWPSALGVMVVWFLGIISGMLYLEAFLAVPNAPHLPTLSRTLTSTWTRRALLFVFIFFSYNILTYSMIFFQEAIHMIMGHFHLPPTTSPALIMIGLLAIFALLLYISRTATLIAISLFFLVLLAFFGYDVYRGKLLTEFSHIRSGAGFFFVIVLGAIFDASFYQSLLPSIIKFLENRKREMLIAIWVGWTAAMVFFLLWIWVTSRPELYSQFLAAFESKRSVHSSFAFLEDQHVLKFFFRALAGSAFSIAIMGVALGLLDFYQDLFNVSPKEHLQKLYLTLLVFVPPILFSQLMHEHILSFIFIASAPLELLLAVFFPLAWVWNLRYKLNIPLPPVLKGGKGLLFLMTLIGFIFLFTLITVPINQME